MPEADRIGELLGFDLALSNSDLMARLCGAPLSFSPSGLGKLVGFDEAGRGALGGPVIVGCVHFRLEGALAADLATIDDSKRLTPRARDRAFAAIERHAVLAFGSASACEIDAVGIVRAAEAAARRAYRRLGLPCSLAVFDRGLTFGEPVPLDSGDLLAGAGKPRGSPGDGGGCRAAGWEKVTNGGASRPANPRPGGHAAVVPRFPPGVGFTRGDMRSLHVAAASIVAKVTRDRIMARLDSAFPGYEFSRHKGYGTERHRVALARLGPSSIHRRSFLHLPDEAESQSC